MELNRREETDRKPPLGRSLVYLLANFPMGIVAVVSITVLITVGVGTAIIWVGVPLLALVIIGVRGAARLERARVRALLGTSIENPYRTLDSTTQKGRWKTRLSDQATWRDIAYFYLLLPISVIQFGLLIGFWSLSLGLIGLPIYYRFLPSGEWRFPTEDLPWVTVGSVPEALPWAALGVLFLAIAVLITKELGAMHAKLACALLGPGKSARVLTHPINKQNLKLEESMSLAAK